jgi:hypothetical protein
MIAFIAMVLSVATAGVIAPSVPIEVRIQAEVSADLRTITGTLSAESHPDLTWVDLLSQLPIPTSDRVQQRTFTGNPEAGLVRLEPAPGVDRPRQFHTILPRRFGAAGLVPGRGLFANGLWHPHPLVDGRLALVKWVVEIKLPPGTLGVLNGEYSHDKVSWSGTAERLALAVIPRARVQEFKVRTGINFTLIDQGMQRHTRDLRTIAIAMTGVNMDAVTSFVVIETPMRRRLVRNGPHTLFMSDRALRVTPPDWQTHIPTVREGLQIASLDVADPWVRGLAGGALRNAVFEVPRARDLVQWRSWWPTIDSYLYDGRIAFNRETFSEGWMSDVLHDDPLEIVESPSPATTTAGKLVGLYGDQLLQTWATAVAAGATVEEASSLSQIPADVIEAWRAHPELQDVSVAVDQVSGGWAVRIIRDAKPDTPSEPISFELDGEHRTWTTGIGPDSLVLMRERRPKKVWVDPDLEVYQANRSNDVWPRPWNVTIAANWAEFNFQEEQITANLFLTGRQLHTSRWVHFLMAATNPIESLALHYNLGYGFGRLTDRRNRIYRASLGPAISWLNEDFRNLQDGKNAIDIRGGFRIDTRDYYPISTKGYRIATDASYGWIPGRNDDWVSSSVELILLSRISPNLVLANQIKAGLTNSSVPHRMLPLGGGDGIQGMPIDTKIGNQRAVSATELRYTPIRDVSVPMWLWWGNSLQFSSSIEAGIVDETTALGWTAGVAVGIDFWGQQDYLFGLWAANALHHKRWSTTRASAPQYYLRLEQAF